MAIQITSNTITPRLNSIKRNFEGTGAELAISRGLDAIRLSIENDPAFPVVSGRLKASIVEKTAKYHIETIEKTSRYGAKGTIGTNMPYARRVEFGFVGADSLGRHYNQQGQYPFTKGFERAKPVVMKVFADYIKSLLLHH